MGEHASKVILNGNLLNDEEASIPITSRGLMYGDGCFETLRAYEGRFLKLENHLKRLKAGLDYLSISCPADLTPNNAKSMASELLSANELSGREGIIRLQVWRKGARGYDPKTANEACYSLTATPLADLKKAVRLSTVEIKRTPSAAVPARYKLSNGINYIAAAAQASRQNADDALLETIEGNASETTIANIFWLKDGTVYTPSVDCDILPGITRSMLLKILEAESNVEVKEGAFPVSELKKADAVWICNSLKEVQAVSGIDNERFDTTNPFIRELTETFVAYRDEQLAK